MNRAKFESGHAIRSYVQLTSPYLQPCRSDQVTGYTRRNSVSGREDGGLRQ